MWLPEGYRYNQNELCTRHARSSSEVRWLAARSNRANTAPSPASYLCRVRGSRSLCQGGIPESRRLDQRSSRAEYDPRGRAERRSDARAHNSGCDEREHRDRLCHDRGRQGLPGKNLYSPKRLAGAEAYTASLWRGAGSDRPWRRVGRCDFALPRDLSPAPVSLLLSGPIQQSSQLAGPFQYYGAGNLESDGRQHYALRGGAGDERNIYRRVPPPEKGNAAGSVRVRPTCVWFSRDRGNQEYGRRGRSARYLRCEPCRPKPLCRDRRSAANVSQACQGRRSAGGSFLRSERGGGATHRRRTRCGTAPRDDRHDSLRWRGKVPDRGVLGRQGVYCAQPASLRANSTCRFMSSSTGPSFSYSTATNPPKF